MYFLFMWNCMLFTTKCQLETTFLLVLSLTSVRLSTFNLHELHLCASHLMTLGLWNVFFYLRDHIELFLKYFLKIIVGVDIGEVSILAFSYWDKEHRQSQTWEWFGCLWHTRKVFMFMSCVLVNYQVLNSK